MNTTRRMNTIATGHTESAAAARTILRAGGNAVDAAIAAVFMDSFVQPCLIGLSGGGFMMIHDGTQTRCIEMMPRIPKSLAKETPASFTEKLTPVDVDFGEKGKPNIQRFWVGKQAVAPPGILPGLVYAKDRYGSDLSWEAILKPTIQLAEQGIVLTPFQGKLVIENLLAEILTGPAADPSSIRLFGNDNGKTLTTGDVFKNPEYAAFLREFIAKPSADALRSAYDAAGITYEPLEIADRDPLVIEYAGERYETVPAPYPGGVMLHSIFERISSLKLAHQSGHVLETETIAGLTQAFRDVFAGYPGLVENLLGNTTHISVYEEHEGKPHAVSITGSLGETAGLVLSGNPANNLLGEEDLNPLLHPDLQRPAAPGSPLLSRQAPTIRHGRNGTVEAIGTGGSTRITTAIAQVLFRRAWGETPHQAVDAPRIHWDHAGGQVRIEAATEETGAALSKALNVPVAVDPVGVYYGGVHVAGSEGAVGDPRREGSTA